MIVKYDKEIDTVYISKNMGNDRWMQLGLTWDERKQIASASTDNLRCWCGNKINIDNCMISIIDGQPEYFCCGECYR